MQPPRLAVPSLDTARALRDADRRTLAGLAWLYVAHGCHLKPGLSTPRGGWKSTLTALREWGAVRGADGAWSQASGTLPPSPALGDCMAVQARLARLHPASTVNAGHRSVRAVAGRAGRIGHDTAVYESLCALKELAEPEKIDRCPPADALVRLSALCRHDAERAALRLMALGVPPPAELLRLTFESFDGEAVEYVRQKTGRRHRIPLDDEGRRLVKWTVAHHDEILPATGRVEKDKSRLLFPWAASYLELWAARLRSGLGADAETYLPRQDRERHVNGCCWYALRHLGATVAGDRHGATEGAALVGDSVKRYETHYWARTRRGAHARRAVVEDVAAALDHPAEPSPLPAALRAEPDGQLRIPGVPGLRRAGGFELDVAALVRAFDAGLLGGAGAPRSPAGPPQAPAPSPQAPARAPQAPAGGPDGPAGAPAAATPGLHPWAGLAAGWMSQSPHRGTDTDTSAADGVAAPPAASQPNVAPPGCATRQGARRKAPCSN